MKETLSNFTFQCPTVLRTSKKMAKALSLPCEGSSALFSEALGARRNHCNHLDSLSLNVILGTLLLSKFMDSFQLSEDFWYWTLICNSFLVLFTRMCIYQSTGVRVFFLGYFSFDNLPSCF